MYRLCRSVVAYRCVLQPRNMKIHLFQGVKRYAQLHMRLCINHHHVANTKRLESGVSNGETCVSAAELAVFTARFGSRFDVMA